MPVPVTERPRSIAINESKPQVVTGLNPVIKLPSVLEQVGKVAPFPLLSVHAKKITVIETKATGTYDDNRQQFIWRRDRDIKNMALTYETSGPKGDIDGSKNDS